MRNTLCLRAGLLAALLSGCSGGPTVQQTTGQDHVWHQRFLREHLTLTLLDSNTVEFTSDRLHPAHPTGKDDSKLRVGSSLIMVDDHASTTYVIRSLAATDAYVDYEAKFDHRSFGKDLITIDTGTVTVPYAKP